MDFYTNKSIQRFKDMMMNWFYYSLKKSYLKDIGAKFAENNNTQTKSR